MTPFIEGRQYYLKYNIYIWSSKEIEKILRGQEGTQGYK